MFEKFGMFNPNLLVCEDYDLWLRFLRYSPVGFIDKVTMTKFGGHADQLSTSFSAMDKFRLFSLLNLYNSESHLLFRELISEKILEKLKVLIQGASKRGLTNDLENYRKIKHEIINQNHLINVELLKFILN